MSFREFHQHLNHKFGAKLFDTNIERPGNNSSKDNDWLLLQLNKVLLTKHEAVASIRPVLTGVKVGIVMLHHVGQLRISQLKLKNKNVL